MNGTTNDLRTNRGVSGLNIIVGIWIFISPWVLGFGQYVVPMWNNFAVGIVLTVCAACRLAACNTKGWSWLNVLLGAWLIASPFALGFANMITPLWNDIFSGAVAILIASSSMAVVRTTPARYERTA